MYGRYCFAQSSFKWKQQKSDETVVGETVDKSSLSGEVEL